MLYLSRPGHTYNQWYCLTFKYKTVMEELPSPKLQIFCRRQIGRLVDRNKFSDNDDDQATKQTTSCGLVTILKILIP